MTDEQEELAKLIDVLTKSHKEAIESFAIDMFIGTATSDQLDKLANDIGMSRQCSHEWVEYVGAREAYSYCKHCDQKAVSDKK